MRCVISNPMAANDERLLAKVNLVYFTIKVWQLKRVTIRRLTLAGLANVRIEMAYCWASVRELTNLCLNQMIYQKVSCWRFPWAWTNHNPSRSFGIERETCWYIGWKLFMSGCLYGRQKPACYHNVPALENSNLNRFLFYSDKFANDSKAYNVHMN